MTEEHFINIESTQIYRGGVGVENAGKLTGDGEEFNRLLNRTDTDAGLHLEFYKEVKLTFECECGERFRKGRTAREHLEEYANE